jgi:hypothetical protein
LRTTKYDKFSYVDGKSLYIDLGNPWGNGCWRFTTVSSVMAYIIGEIIRLEGGGREY